MDWFQAPMEEKRIEEKKGGEGELKGGREGKKGGGRR